MLFPLGRLVQTAGVAHESIRNPFFATEVRQCIERHKKGDWGDLSDNDKQANQDALVHGDQILSAYNTREGSDKVYVITEYDRSVTTVLFASEY